MSRVKYYIVLFSAFIFAFFGLSTSIVFAQTTPKRIYIANDDHTDFLWSAGENVYKQAFTDMIDYYVAQADQYAGNPPEYQGKFNLDGSYWVYVYEKAKTLPQFQNLIAKMQSKHITMPLNGLSVLFGGQTTESVLRGMYYPGILERKYNLDFDMAYAMENMTMPYGLSSLWAGSGAKYTWQGVCNCSTSVTGADNRTNQMYWWEGVDGSKILTKWYSIIGGNDGIGGYAEARSPSAIVDFVDTDVSFTSINPYRVIGAFGKGWDDLTTFSNEFITAAQSKTNTNRQVIVSNQTDFFEDFNTTYGATLPSQSLSFGNEWELDSASMVETFAKVRRAVEKLRNAEGLATLVSLRNPSFTDQFESSKIQAWNDIAIFWEHNISASNIAYVQERIDWQKRLASEIESYVDNLENSAKIALTSMISGGNNKFYVFNSLGWNRTDFVDLPYTPSGNYKVIDSNTQLEVPAQVVGTKTRIMATDVPSVGYKIFEILPEVATNYPVSATVSGNTIENSKYRVTLQTDGSITSIYDKVLSKEFVGTVNSKNVNDLGNGAGTISTENIGPVSATIVANATTPINRTVKVTLYKDSDRIQIDNFINQGFNSTYLYSYAFNLNSPNVLHEELGTFMEAVPSNLGGKYSTTQSKLEYLTFNHFLDMKGSDNTGVVLSNWDVPYFKLGTSTGTNLDTNTPLVQPVLGGRIDGGHIPDQGGITSFTQRFAIKTYLGRNQTTDMKFSLEHQNPLIANSANVLGSDYIGNSYSLLNSDNSDSLIWSVKPSEEGITNGLMVRLWNTSDSGTTANISAPNLTLSQVTETTHIETNKNVISSTANSFNTTFTPQQLKTFRLSVSGFPTPSPTPVPTPSPTPSPSPSPSPTPSPTPALVAPKVETGSINGVSSTSWTTVNLTKNYTSMVVSATVRNVKTNQPAVTRIRNVTNNSFEIKLDMVKAGATLSNAIVDYIAIEEGTYTLASNGIKMEAKKYTSTITNHDANWTGTTRTYTNSYTTPVVIGQVMSYNDPNWSVFWATSSTRANPPSSTSLRMGKTVDEDPNITRANEVIGYLVFESGNAKIDNIDIKSAVSADTARGMGNAPPYNYTYTSNLTGTVGAVMSTAGLDAVEGGWPIIYGNSGVSTTSISTAIDEDEIGDIERTHTTDQIAYLVFELSNVNPTATPSPTPVPTASPTPSPTPVPTSSPSPTPVPTPSPTPSPTPVPTASPSPSPTPSPTPVACFVETSPLSINLLTGEVSSVSASVVSGLGTSTVAQMRFGSYNTLVATINPSSDTIEPYNTSVSAVSGGSTAIWASADLSDGRICETTGTTDTDINITNPATPTPFPTASPSPSPTPSPTPVAGTFPSTTVLDNFNRANGTLTTPWVGDLSSYQISSNQLLFPSGVNDGIVFRNAQYGANQEAYVKFNSISANADEYNLILKAQSTSTAISNDMIEVLYNPRLHIIQVWTRSGGAWQQRGSNISKTLVAGDVLGGKVISSANQVEIYVNGVKISTVTFTWNKMALPGYIGLWTIDNTNTNTLMDDFGGGSY